jgi:hypothetical protein
VPLRPDSQRDLRIPQLSRSVTHRAERTDETALAIETIAGAMVKTSQ